MKKSVKVNQKVKVWDKIVDWFLDQIIKNENQIIAEAESHIAFTNKILNRF